jgi:hypothetical protein
VKIWETIKNLWELTTRKNQNSNGGIKIMPASNSITLEVSKNQVKALKTILNAYITDNSDVSSLSASEIHAIAHAKKLLEKLG